MRKFNIDTINKWLIAIQGIAVILGVLFAGWQLWELVQQTTIQSQTLVETRQVDSANFLLTMEDRLDGNKYKDIIYSIEYHNEFYPILQTKDGGKGGNFSWYTIEDYISNFEDVGILMKNKLVSEKMAYDDFSYDVEKAWCNRDIQKIITSDRKGYTNVTDSYWANFQNLANDFLAKDSADCKWVDTQ